jgi:hypothetical protein
MTNQGGGWVLIGAGRASNNDSGGWFGSNAESNTGYLVSSTYKTCPNNTIAKVSAEFVNYLMNGTASGWQNGNANNYLIINRISDATDGLGSIGNFGNGGVGDSVQGKITNDATFKWVQYIGGTTTDNSGLITGTGAFTRYSQNWLNGSITGATNAVNMVDNDWGGSNDWRRAFTWHWSGHGPWHGISAGSTVLGSGQGQSGGFTQGSEGHAIQYCHWFIR